MAESNVAGTVNNITEEAFRIACDAVDSNITFYIDKKFIDEIKQKRLDQVADYLESRPALAHHFKNKKQLAYTYDLTVIDISSHSKQFKINHSIDFIGDNILPFKREEEYRRKHGFWLSSGQFIGQLVFYEGITQLPRYASVWASAHAGETDEDGNQVTYNNPGTGWVDNMNINFNKYVLDQSLNDYLEGEPKTEMEEKYAEKNREIVKRFKEEYAKALSKLKGIKK